jgi:hypothetical protein
MRGVETQWNVFEQGPHLALLCYCGVFKARLQQTQARYHAVSTKQIALSVTFNFVTDSGLEFLHEVTSLGNGLRPSKFKYKIHGYPLGAAASLP